MKQPKVSTLYYIEFTRIVCQISKCAGWRLELPKERLLITPYCRPSSNNMEAERDDKVLISSVSLRRHNHGHVFVFINLPSCNTDWTWQTECGFNIKYYHIQDMKQSTFKYRLSHRMC